MADDKKPDPAAVPGEAPTVATTPAFVEIVLPRSGTTIPQNTPQLRVEIYSTQPALPHFVQFFRDVSHVPNTIPTAPPADVILGTSQAQVMFNDPIYVNIGTAFLIPPQQPAGAGQPNYLLTCWVGNDINLRYTGQVFLNQMPERIVQVASPPTPPTPPGGPGNSPPPPADPTI